MPKALDVAYVVYQVPDLDRMESFMQDFGLVTTERRDHALYMRGAGPAPYVHVTRRGPEPRFIGGALRMASRADLEALAALPGSSPLEAIADAPGGGWRVRMATPDGIAIDAVWGQDELPRLPHRRPNPFNAGDRKERINVSLRPKRERGLVLRLGHFVLRVSNHDQTLAWFRERFGLLPSDMMCTPDGSRVFGTFVRCDRGGDLVDHHSMLIIQADPVGVHHCSFEMQDLDCVMGAHDYLVARGHRLDCGVGRHLIGSQIFDYWRDPFGFRVEHYTDGDVADQDHEPNRYSVRAEETTQWGMDPPPDFFD
jgi:hypothetical protein